MTVRIPLAAAVAAAAMLIGAGSAPAAPVACTGTVHLTGMSNVEASEAGVNVFVEFDFTGTHDICLADGSVVTGTIAGHLMQRTSADGSLSIRFDEVLSYGGGTLSFRGEASLAGGNWQSHVQSVGSGTGPLAGMHGQGSFWFTGPTSLVDVIAYVYAPRG